MRATVFPGLTDRGRDIGAHGDGRGACRVGPAASGEVFGAVGEEDAARSVDHGAHAVLVETHGDIVGPGALRAVARYQEDETRITPAKRRSFRRIGGADDDADGGIAAVPDAAATDAVSQCGRRVVEGPSVVDGAVLEVRRAGVRGLGQEEQSPPMGRMLDERLYAVAAQVGVDGDGIGTEAGKGAVAQVILGIGLRRRADVAALGVADDQKPLCPGPAHHLFQGLKAGRSQPFEERHLRFDHGNHVVYRIDDADTEVAHHDGECVAVGGVDALRHSPGHQAEMGIEPHNHGAVPGADGGAQAVGEIVFGHGPVPDQRLPAAIIAPKHPIVSSVLYSVGRVR